MFTADILTKVTVSASPEEVIALIVNSKDYSWNTFLKTFKVTGGPTGEGGEVVEGSTLMVEMDPEKNGKLMKFTPRVLVKTPTELRWLGLMGSSLLFSGEHFFIAEAGDTPGECILTHGEKFSGAIIPLFKMLWLKGTTNGFEALNEGVKAHFAK